MKVRLAVLATLASVAIALLLAQPVGAATGGGTVQQLSQQVTAFQLVGNEALVKGTAVDQFAGTLNGTANMKFTAAADASGVTRVVVTGSCVCTVQDRSGTVHLVLVLRDTTAIGGVIQGTLWAQGQSGDLTTFRGLFHVLFFSYSGFYSL